jgi:predicted DNA-binding transcriptional regulator AlpA
MSLLFGGLRPFLGEDGMSTDNEGRLIEDRLVDGKEAGEITGVKSRTQRHRLIKLGRFPQPVKVESSTRYSARECYEYARERIAERDKKVKEG